jgi:prepilin-type processing-associated H-X9-DG protein
MQCTNHLKQFGLALHNHHDAKQKLPEALMRMEGCYNVEPRPAQNNYNRGSVFISLLPYIEQQALYDAAITATVNPASNTAPYTTTVSTMLCPSDSAGNAKAAGDRGRNNYLFSLGDWADKLGNGQANFRGAFVLSYSVASKLSLLRDGTSNTIAVSEHPIAMGQSMLAKVELNITGGDVNVNDNVANINPRNCLQLAQGLEYASATGVQTGEPSIGKRWADGRGLYTYFSTILPPNSPSCHNGGPDTRRFMNSAGSYHNGGVNAARFDGSVSFIASTIDCGPDLTVPPPSGDASPYGIWGALGSIDGRENTSL